MKVDTAELSSKQRGRPKTLNCNDLIDIAMKEYWLDETNSISLNEICKRAKVSKPGIYREFGNEDGLIEAILLKYEKEVTSQFLGILEKEEELSAKIQTLAFHITSNTEDKHSKKGCLLVKIQNSKANIGQKTQKQISCMQTTLLQAYERCIHQAKEKGQFKADISNKLAAEYFNAQINHATLLFEQGYEDKKVRDILILSLSIFI